jgi:hypothetical protein
MELRYTRKNMIIKQKFRNMNKECTRTFVPLAILVLTTISQQKENRD